MDCIFESFHAISHTSPSTPCSLSTKVKSLMLAFSSMQRSLTTFDFARRCKESDSIHTIWECDLSHQQEIHLLLSHIFP